MPYYKHLLSKTSILRQREPRIKELKNYIFDKLEDEFLLDYSPTTCWGVKACKYYPKKTILMQYRGDIITPDEAATLEVTYAKDKQPCCLLYFNDNNSGHVIDPTPHRGIIARYCNHSIKNKNAAPKLIVVDGKAIVVLIAWKNIKPGEEILWDYGDRNAASLAANPWLRL
ncbi:hypothetical protein TKK_0011681 [Trichogramma kaykai]